MTDRTDETEDTHGIDLSGCALQEFIRQARAGRLDPQATCSEAHGATRDGLLPDEPMHPGDWQRLHGKERQREYARQWRKANREHIRRYKRDSGQLDRQRERERERMRDDPEYAARRRQDWRQAAARKKLRMRDDPEYAARVRAQQHERNKRRRERKRTANPDTPYA